MNIVILILVLIILVLNIYAIFFRINKSHVESGISTWPKVGINRKSKNKIIVNDDKKILLKENSN